MWVLQIQLYQLLISSVSHKPERIIIGKPNINLLRIRLVNTSKFMQQLNIAYAAVFCSTNVRIFPSGGRHVNVPQEPSGQNRFF